MKIKITFFFIALFLNCQLGMAQVNPVKKDSVKMYSDIEKFSKRSKFSKFMYKLIFRAQATKKVEQKKKSKKQVSTYLPYEGKVIRNIKIESIDPFGYSITDTIDRPGRWIERAGNGIHVRSKPWTVRNYMLFNLYDTFDSIKIKESERLIQSQRFVRRTLIIPKRVKGSNDSIDVVVRVLDSWSLIPTGSYSNSGSKFRLTERNFFGLGHEMVNEFKSQKEAPANGYTFRYTVPNFRNTFIKTYGLYTNDFLNNKIREVATERAFFSPLTKYAGGASYTQRAYTDSIADLNQMKVARQFKYDMQNYWAGYSVPIFRGNKEEDRITNLVSTLRYSQVNYIWAPEVELDSLGFFTDSKLYLASIGITRRKFIEDSFLFNYGIQEYVQIGQTISVTGGFEDKNANKRTYFGGRYALGDYFSFGYLGLSTELGSFISNRKTEQTTLKVDLNYFTNLFEMGNWRIRQFIQPQLLIGNNRLPGAYDRITINDESGIQGFSTELRGTKKLIVAFQTQTYAPGMFWGFRLSPFLNATLGMLSDDGEHLMRSPLYSKIGIGIMLSNDYLVFNSFQLSFAFYPKVPGEGTNIFKTNSFQNDDLQLLDYGIGQPLIVPYK